MGSIIDLFPRSRGKRYNRALKYLAEAYSAHLDAEQATLNAFLQIDGEGDKMTEEEKNIADLLKRCAENLKVSAEGVREIMRDIAAQKK